MLNTYNSHRLPVSSGRLLSLGCSTVSAMRWEALFDDLEAQLEVEAAAELRAEVAERSRAEVAQVQLADRVRAHTGAELTLRLRDGQLLRGRCRDVAVEWLVLDDGTSATGTAQVLVPLAAVTTVGGLSRAVAPAPGAVLRRLGLPHALRALARNRAPVCVHVDGGTVTGTIDRVGADHVDVAEHPVGEPRRAEAVRGVAAVRLAALTAVRSAVAEG